MSRIDPSGIAISIWRNRIRYVPNMKMKTVSIPTTSAGLPQWVYSICRVVKIELVQIVPPLLFHRIPRNPPARGRVVESVAVKIEPVHPIRMLGRESESVLCGVATGRHHRLAKRPVVVSGSYRSIRRLHQTLQDSVAVVAWKIALRPDFPNQHETPDSRRVVHGSGEIKPPGIRPQGMARGVQFGDPQTQLLGISQSLAADLYKPPTGVVTLRHQCGRVTPAVRTGYDTNQEQSTTRAWLGGGCTGSGHSRRLVLHSRGDGGSVRSKPGYWARIYHLTQEILPRSLRCHFGSFYDPN